MWSYALDRHIRSLRTQLLTHKELWPTITRRAHVGKHTVAGFAHQNPAYRNPTIRTLKNIANALDALLDKDI